MLKINLKVKLEEETHKEHNKKEYRKQQALDIVNQSRWANVDTLAKFVEAIVDKSEGMFLSSVYVVLDIKVGGISLNQSIREFKESLPKGIYKFYEDRFKKMFKNDMKNYRENVRPVLEIIAAARELIPRDMIEKASALNGADYDALGEVTTFCKDRGDQETYAFFHMILNEHEEKEKTRIVVSKDKGHQAIANAFMKSSKEEWEVGYLYNNGVACRCNR